jgi:hypothetical protein
MIDARRAALAHNAVGMLRHSPRQPALGALPKTWQESIIEWEREQLTPFLSVDQHDWSVDV